MMSVLFSSPKPPKVNIPPTPETLPPPAPPPPLPPPAPEAPEVQDAAAEVRKRQRQRGRKQTVLTSPVGVVEAPAAKTLLSA